MTGTISEQPPVRRAPTRRRGDALISAIYDAVLEQLETVGYTRLSMAGVATAAGTGKAALYRRWSSKEELVACALRYALPAAVDVPVRGDLRSDIRALLFYLRDASALHGSAFQTVKAEAGEALMHGVVQERVIDPGTEMIVNVLQQGVQRGEVRATAASLRVASVGPAMLIHYALTRGAAIPDDFIDSVVDDVMLPMVRA